MGSQVSKSDLHTDLDGETLHRIAKPEYRCVTKRDLKRLRADVKEAIAMGVIVPTCKDAFGLTDDVVGPSIYSLYRLKLAQEKVQSVTWC